MFSSLIEFGCLFGRKRQSVRQSSWRDIVPLPDNCSIVQHLITSFSLPHAVTCRRVLHHVIMKTESQDLSQRALMEKYASGGAVEDANALFATLLERDLLLWNLLIRAFTRKGQDEKARQLFDQMMQEGVMPDKHTFVVVLSACLSLAILLGGKQLHLRIIEGSEFECDVIVGTALVNMYGKCGRLNDVQTMFEQMPQRNSISWNVFIGAHVQNGKSEEALQLFHRMQTEALLPNKFTFATILDAYAAVKASPLLSKQVHARVVQSEFQSDVVLGTALVYMYGKCGLPEEALQVFNQLVEKNVASWNAMIVAYTQHGAGNEALQLFDRMQQESLVPNKITFTSILCACASNATLAEGLRIHARFVGSGVDSDIVMQNSLVNMYGKCGILQSAQQMFENMPEQNVVTWNAMFAALAHHKQGKDALGFFYHMLGQGMLPNKVTYVSIFDACASQAVLAYATQMHACIVGSKFESDVVVGTALINMYVKCCGMESAHRIFDRMPEHNVVSWNAMISGCVQHKQEKEALHFFKQMQQKEMSPNKVTFISVLEACTSLATLAEGEQVHALILCTVHESDVAVGTALINMYGKSGSLNFARRIFDRMTDQNVLSWNAMIATYAQHGQVKEMFYLLYCMSEKEIVPDDVTLVSILSACSHAGLVDEGLFYFISMSRDNTVVPTMDHYSCMIDLLGRAGRLDEGEHWINNMPFDPSAVCWMTLLSACRNFSDEERGWRAASHVFKLEPHDAAPYIMLYNIYAAGKGNDE